MASSPFNALAPIPDPAAAKAPGPSLAAAAPVAAGPAEDKADLRGDVMRPRVDPRTSVQPTGGADAAGQGHMGAWADKVHPPGGKPKR